MYESNNKNVSHPSHYQSETGLEVIDVIEAFTFNLSGVEATDTGNVIKYICRWKEKNGLEDLEKAKWYLTHLIDHVKLLEKENNEEEGKKEPFDDNDLAIAEFMDILFGPPDDYEPSAESWHEYLRRIFNKNKEEK